MDYVIPEYRQLFNKVDKGILPKITAPAHFFILEDEFVTTKSISERRNILLGYIGRFSKNKGVKNFFEVITLILGKNDKVRFLIAGEGVLKEWVENKIRELAPDRVTLIDWIPHEKLPEYLNELKLLVIPFHPFEDIITLEE